MSPLRQVTNERRSRQCWRRVPLLAVIVALLQLPAARAETLPFITVQSTTSTASTGLFDDLLPRVRAALHLDIRVIAVGTGQALKNAADGNADVVLVHAPAAEAEFIAAGHGVERLPLMYNQFVIVGPAHDPAGVSRANSARDAFSHIATHHATFVSRGDLSGTHMREMELWRAAGVTVTPAHDLWYRDSGSAMDRALAVAVELDAYTLADRASWLAFTRRRNHRQLYAGDPALFNQYSLILVNPSRHPAVKAAAGRAFIDWLRGADGQAAIAAFRVAGEPVFFPNAQCTPGTAGHCAP